MLFMKVYNVLHYCPELECQVGQVAEGSESGIQAAVVQAELRQR